MLTLLSRLHGPHRHGAFASCAIAVAACRWNCRRKRASLEWWAASTPTSCWTRAGVGLNCPVRINQIRHLASALFLLSRLLAEGSIFANQTDQKAPKKHPQINWSAQLQKPVARCSCLQWPVKAETGYPLKIRNVVPTQAPRKSRKIAQGFNGAGTPVCRNVGWLNSSEVQDMKPRFFAVLGHRYDESSADRTAARINT